jgi:TPR repeat protein
MKRPVVVALFIAAAAGYGGLLGAVENAHPPAEPERRSSQAPRPLDGSGDSGFLNDQAEAIRGDGNAAYRVAQMFRQGTNGVARDTERMLEWLRWASDLGTGAASYQLYLHYLGLGLDRDALNYENRARQQGFVPPPRLDPRRG